MNCRLYCNTKHDYVLSVKTENYLKTLMNYINVTYLTTLE